MMQKQPEIGEFYTRKNGKVYEARLHGGCVGCAFYYSNHCDKVLCTNIIYIRRKDLEA